MLQGRDIIVFTYADWHAVKSTPQHLSKLLAQTNRVLYVDMPRSFLRFLKGVDSQGAGAWSGKPLQEGAPNLFVFHPPHRFLPIGQVPFPVARRTLRVNGYFLARMVREQAHRLGFKDPILWNFSPIHGGAAPFIPRALSVHDICDEWANYLEDRAGRRLVDWMDRRLAASADIVFVFSQHMRARREGLCPETHVVLPAGDVAHYSKANDPALAAPRDIARLPHPIIGAICVIDRYRFDVGLIARMAALRPQWSIALLGPVRGVVDFTPLERFPNVHLMGNRPLEDMPAYLKGMDAALVPYAINEATKGIYPMKIQEYLAGSKPVVCPRLPECLHLEEVVYFAEAHDEFVTMTDRALAEDNPERQAARRTVAEQNSWRRRLEQRSDHIERLLRAREGCVAEVGGAAGV